MKIAITGGIGTGKSTLLNYLKNNYDIPIFSMDDIVHDAIQNPKVVQYCLDTFKTIDRKTIGKIVFESKDPFKLLLLENVTNEFFYEKLKVIFNNNNTFFMEAPILYEKGLQVLFDKIIVVSCDLETRIKRIQKRDNRSVENINSILKKQLPQEIKNQLADFVYINEDTYQNNDDLNLFINNQLTT